MKTTEKPLMWTPGEHWPVNARGLLGRRMFQAWARAFRACGDLEAAEALSLNIDLIEEY